MIAPQVHNVAGFVLNAFPQEDFKFPGIFVKKSNTLGFSYKSFSEGVELSFEKAGVEIKPFIKIE